MNHGAAMVLLKFRKENLQMKILGFVHAGVVVEDINKAIEFYNGVLGLEIVDGPGEWVTDFSETRAMGLGDVLHRIAHLKCADGSQVELIEFENPRNLAGSDLSDYNGKEHMSFLVDDINAYVEKLAEYDLHPFAAPMGWETPDAKTGTAYWMMFKDPFGVVIEMMQM